MPLSLIALLAMANQCAPSVAPQTLASVVAVESGFDPLAVGVNGPRHRRLHPQSLGEAAAVANRLIAHGANVDLGLAQINGRNLARLGLSVADAFDPCRNLAASAKIIEAGYERAGPLPGAEQLALRTSLSLYNTGDVQRGFRNGYVAKVMAAAGRIVPPLQPTDAEATAAPTPPQPAPAAPPPAWDVFAQAPAASASFVFTPDKFTPDKSENGQ
jgi:type IV secretion system protein VirB1